MLAGLSKWDILSMPPGFWAKAASAVYIAISSPPTVTNALRSGFIFVRLPLFIARLARKHDARRKRLPVEPDVFHAPAVEDAVDHRRQPLDLRLPAGRCEAVQDDRPCPILLQLPVDLPHQLLAFFLIGLARLPVERLVELRIAISGIVTVRAARIVFVELLVGVVDPAAGVVEPDHVVLAAHLAAPLAALDRFDLSVHLDPLALLDQDHRRIAIGGHVARRHLAPDPPVRPIAELLHH